MSNSIGLVILSAGQGVRLKMKVPKPLAPALGKCLVDFPITESFRFIEQNKLQGEISLVTGHMREDVEKYVNENYPNKPITYAFQDKQLGTAHALRCYFEQVPQASKFDYTVVLCADTPLIRAHDLSQLYLYLQAQNLDGVAATFVEKNPKGYGRIVRSEKAFHIVEEKDASDEIRKITEVNSGLYILKTSFILKHLNNIDSKNKSGEFYLTDLFKDHFNVAPLLFENPETFIGVNTLRHLEDVERILTLEKTAQLRDEGVRFLQSTSCYIDWEVTIGEGSIVQPNVMMTGKCKIGKQVSIGAGSVLKNAVIEDGAVIKPYTVIENGIIRAEAEIGPFARIRPDSDIGPKSKIGNFVETKKVKLEKGVKVSHLSYVGDAEVGEESNLGCGFITCNYDGAKKHKTKIGKNCFIGSDSQMIAPIEIGDNCYVGSGSTINKSMPAGSFAIARARQETKEGLAQRFIKKKE